MVSIHLQLATTAGGNVSQPVARLFEPVPKLYRKGTLGQESGTMGHTLLAA